MKIANEELIKYLLYDEGITKSYKGSIDFSTKYVYGTKGWFFWSKTRYENVNKIYGINNYALLDNGLLIAYGVYSTTSCHVSDTPDAIYLGEGVYHFGIKGSSFKYDPPESCYK